MTLASTSLSLDGEVVARLLAAALLAGFVGAEREASDQPAGLRTHIAVGLGAALFGVVSTLGFVEFDQRRANTVLQADVTRVASQVVVGIGFLGAGVIFRQGNQIRNLTTAASLWVVAAIGVACGVGDIGTAALGTAVLLASLIVLRPIRSLIRRYATTERTRLRVEVASAAATAPVIEAVDDLRDVDVTHVAIEKNDGRTVLTIDLHTHGQAARRAAAALAEVPGVEAVAHD